MAHLDAYLLSALHGADSTARFLVYIKKTSSGTSTATLSKAEIETLSLDPDVVYIKLSQQLHPL